MPHSSPTTGQPERYTVAQARSLVGWSQPSLYRWRKDYATFAAQIGEAVSSEFTPLMLVRLLLAQKHSKAHPKHPRMESLISVWFAAQADQLPVLLQESQPTTTSTDRQRLIELEEKLVALQAEHLSLKADMVKVIELKLSAQEKNTADKIAAYFQELKNWIEPQLPSHQESNLG
jgi:hypothetical protein